MAVSAREKSSRKYKTRTSRCFRLEIIQRFVDSSSVISRERNVGCFMEARSVSFLGSISGDVLTDVVDGHAVRDGVEPGAQ